MGESVVAVPDGGAAELVAGGPEDPMDEPPVGVEVGVPDDPMDDPLVPVGVGPVVVLEDASGVRVGPTVGSVGLTAGRGSGDCGPLST
ncbi:hypothetical protein ACIQI8_07220 [Streptomyces sp. NPDC092369]|uniref:hypothetical protein n=1 Tax=Streptomyces sp. NPDC092369 TaxID=3366015 RepID=UPI0037FFB007